MKRYIPWLLLIALLMFAAKYSSDAGGTFIYPQQIAAVPAQPHACAASNRGQMIYVDDNNDTAESYLCFCGVDADDTTYIWLKVQDPTANCF